MNFKSLAGMMSVALLAMAGEVEAQEAVEIGNRVEPLLDDYLIAKLSGARLTLHHPIPREVAVEHDAPWEGCTSAYHTVFQDGDLYRMYYRGSHYEPGNHDVHPQLVCYAESKDGIHWTKPDLGIYEFEKSKKNSIVWMGIGSHNFAPFKDTNPNCAEDARYKALGSGKGGLYAFQSADAIHWSLLSDKPVITEGAFDSQNLAFWDGYRGRYVDFHRGFRNGVRDIMTCTSGDFLNWTKPAWLEYPGSPPEHLYTNQITPCPLAPHIFLGFPKRFVPGRTVIAHQHPGVSDGVFMTSRDGLKFRRWQEALIRPGLQSERWVNRNNMTAWGIVNTKSDLQGAPDEWSIYSTEGYYQGNAARIRRFAVRVNGFVSVQAPMSGGQMLTKPLVFSVPKQPKDMKTPPADAAVVASEEKPIAGRRSLEFRKPTVMTLPGTKSLGSKVTLAVTVRGVARGHRRLFSAYDGGPFEPKELYMDVGIKDAPIRFGYDGELVQASPAEISADIFADAETAHHVAVTYDDGEVTIYCDGKQVARGGKPGKGAMELRLGDLRYAEDYPPTSLTNEAFVGIADDILVLRRVLSADEVKQMAAKGAAAVLDQEVEDGILYTVEGGEVQVLRDQLKHDGEQNGTLAGPGEVELVINYSTSAPGSIKCEIQDASGKPIPGYTLADSDEVYGDQLERAVSWRGASELKQLAGKPIRLRFVLKDADLYSIQFK